MPNKLLNISLYLGGAPFYWLYGKITHKNGYDNKHYTQVLGINILICFSFIIFLISFFAHTLVIRFFRNLATKLPLELSFYILGGLLIVCLAVSLEGVIAALIGYKPKLIVIASIIKTDARKRFSIAVTLIHLLTMITVMTIAFHSSYLVSNENNEADVYMFYDDMGYIPRWVFALGFYPESLAAKKSLGMGEVVVVPFTKDTLDKALNHGKLIYIAAHGAEDFMVLQDGQFLWPSDIHTDLISDNLQYVYLSACDSSKLHHEWQEAFGSAEIKTFGRLSTVAEHVKWLWFDGPKIIDALK